MRWIIISLLLHGLVFLILLSFPWQREEVEIKLNYKFKEMVEKASEKREIRKKFPQDLKINVFQRSIFTGKNPPLYFLSESLKEKGTFPERVFSVSSFTKIYTFPLSPLDKRENYSSLEDKEEIGSSSLKPLFFKEELFSGISSPFSLRQKEKSYFSPSSLPGYFSTELPGGKTNLEKIELSKGDFLFISPARYIPPKKREEVFSPKKVSLPYSYPRIRNNQEALTRSTCKTLEKKVSLSPEIAFEEKIQKIKDKARVILEKSSSERRRELSFPQRSLEANFNNKKILTLKKTLLPEKSPHIIDSTKYLNKLPLDLFFSPKITFSLKKPCFIEEKTSPRETFIFKKEEKIKIHKAKIEKRGYPLPLDREKISSNLSCLSWIKPEKIKRKGLLSTGLLPPGEERRRVFSSLPSPISLTFSDGKDELLPSPASPLPSRTTCIDEGHPLLPLPELSSFDEYLKTVLKIIEKNKKYPSGARKRGEEGKVKVSFTLLKSGKVKDVKIITPSRYPELNKATEKLIWELSPFPPFPPGVEKKKITLAMEVIYEIEENP